MPVFTSTHVPSGALARGDKVIATCRGDPHERLRELRAAGAAVLALDVTAPVPAIGAFARAAVAVHGRVDVVCNNAGYLQHGAVEAVRCAAVFVCGTRAHADARVWSPEETMRQFATAFFGPRACVSRRG